MRQNQTPFETQLDIDQLGGGRRRLNRAVVLGAGPVGRAIAAELVGRGVSAAVATRRGTVVPGVVSLQVDATAPDRLAAALEGADTVFHCVQPAYHRWAEDFPALQRSIVDATARVGATLIAVENLYGYGPVDGVITEATPMAPNTRKGAVRAALWSELEAAHNKGRLPVAAVRASDFLGPGVTASSYGERFIDPLIAGKAADVLGDPDTRHSVTYVPDLAAAMVRIAEEPSSWGRAWIAPTAPAVTQRQLVDMVAAAAGTSPRLRVVKPWMLRLAGLFNPAPREMVELAYEFDHDFVVDSSAIEQRFGLTPTSLADAVAATVAAARAATGAGTR